MEHPLVEAFAMAWDRHSADAVRATLSKDATYEVVPQGRIFGRDKVEEQVAFMHGLSSGFSMSAVSVLRDGDRYAVEWELAGTNDGPGAASLGTVRPVIQGPWHLDYRSEGREDRLVSCLLGLRRTPQSARCRTWRPGRLADGVVERGTFSEDAHHKGEMTRRRARGIAGLWQRWRQKAKGRRIPDRMSSI